MSSALKFEPKRILVFRIGHLGDTLVALPAFWALRKRFPDAHITLLSNVSAKNAGYPTAQGVLPAKGLFDEFISYPNEAGKAASALGFLKLGAAIRMGRYDTLAYLMTRNRDEGRVKRDLSFFRMAGIGQHFGTKHLMTNFLPENGKAPLPEVEPEYKYLLKCLSEEGIIDAGQGISTDLLLGGDESVKAVSWIELNAGDTLAGKNFVAVAPGSKWESKLWPEEKYAEVLSRLITQKNIFPIIFGGPEDRDKGERILQKLGMGANAAGELSIREAAAALQQCKLYLGNDTGTMHLAAAVGVPCVAVFAAIDYPGRWVPFGDNNVVLRKAVPCEGCHSPICKFNHECLEIGIEEVCQACINLLDRSGFK
ncbi:MAG TPA: glycosyltransferase family 9 protein [Pyrinomonadaceae bacterium]|nr:glycosyltransferase family 9 protein [Pyrinomonadaceae bacterium]